MAGALLRFFGLEEAAMLGYAYRHDETLLEQGIAPDEQLTYP